MTRSIQVDARGEVAELKDNINTMIDNLRLTTDRNTEQDWLKTNVARFTNMLQGQRDLTTVGKMLLSELAPLVSAQNGVIYLVQTEETPSLKLLSAYADADDKQGGHAQRLQVGQGLVGQCAADAKRMLIAEVPANVVPIRSGLFKLIPKNVIVLPVLFEGQVKAVIELASAGAFTDLQVSFLDQLTASIGIVLNSIEATMQTEGLLKQSQQLATELQTQQRELQQTNEQLEQKAQQLAERNVEGERSRRRPPSWRSPRNTNPNSSPTCRMSCARRSTASSSSASSSSRTPTAISAPSRSSSRAPSTPPAPTCSTSSATSSISPRSSPAPFRSTPRTYSSPTCWTWWRARSPTSRKPPPAPPPPPPIPRPPPPHSPP